METKVKCVYCNKPIWPGEKDSYRKVIGWVHERGGKGGAHSVHDMDPTGEYMHGLCWRDKQLGGQKSLL